MSEIEVITQRTELRRRWPRKTVRVNGCTFTVYSRSWLAWSCGVTVKALQGWHSNGTLPPPILKVAEDQHWYTAAEIAGYGRLYKMAAVKRGKFIPIQGMSPMQRFAKWNRDFHAKLSVIIQKDTGKIPEKLKDEDKILSAGLHDKKPDWSKLVDQLIRQ